MLDLAKIEARKMDLTLTPLALSPFLHQIIGIIRERAEAKDLALTYQTRSPLPDGVLADEKRLRQVLLNLLGNAIRFTDRGSVCLMVEVIDQTEVEAGEPEATLRFTVKDTGVGMASEQLDRIFLPFEQVSRVGPRAEGVGLGLAISQHIVHLMGSQLQVKSTPGQGSTFWFDVTMSVPSTTEQVEPPATQAIVGYEGPRRRVLVVDDKDYNRRVLVDMLEPLGFTVYTANDGQQAVDKASQLSPDVIMMDLVMPGKTGLEAAQEMRQRPEFKNVVIVAVSASVLNVDREKSLMAGCDAFLPKPIRMENLLDVLVAHLKLTWIFAKEESSSEGPLVAPPIADLVALHRAAESGRIWDIREQARRLIEQNETYVPFATRLQELARSFDNDQIVTFIEQFIKEED